MYCLFCNGLEPNYKPTAHIDYICSRCVQVLLSADQGQLQQASQYAIEKGLTRKARAIEKFLIEQEYTDDSKTESIRRNLVRERSMRSVRPSRNQMRTQSATI